LWEHYSKFYVVEKSNGNESYGASKQATETIERLIVNLKIENEILHLTYWMY